MMIVLFLLSLEYLAIGIFFQLRPIKKRNPILGFRTRSSIASQAAWNKANKDLFMSMTVIGLISLIVYVGIYACVALGKIINPDVSSLVAIIIQSILMVIVIVVINRKLQYLQTGDD